MFEIKPASIAISARFGTPEYDELRMTIAARCALLGMAEVLVLGQRAGVAFRRAYGACGRLKRRVMAGIR